MRLCPSVETRNDMIWRCSVITAWNLTLHAFKDQSTMHSTALCRMMNHFVHESHNERGRARDKHPKNTGAKVQCQTFQKEMGSDEEAHVSCKQVAQGMHPGLGRTTVKMWFGRLEVKDGAVLASSGLGTYIWREFSKSHIPEANTTLPRM